MAKTFRNQPTYAFAGRIRTKKRSRVSCTWADTTKRSNRQAVRSALTRGDWDRAMDVGAPLIDVGELR